MTKDEFIQEDCQRSGIEWEQLSKRQEVRPCNCGDELCQGWAMVSKDPMTLKAHKALYETN